MGGVVIVVIGLTGGIACGKSAVADALRRGGVPVVDADAVARDVVKPGTAAFGRIVADFGPTVVAADGTLDRRALGRAIFGDASAKARLEAMTHPAIATLSAQAFARLAAEGHEVVVYEAALLVETGRHKTFPALIVVTASPAVQRARLLARDPDLSPADADARIASQMAVGAKAELATWVIDNDDTPAALDVAVARLIGDLQRFVQASKPAATAV